MPNFYNETYLKDGTYLVWHLPVSLHLLTFSLSLSHTPDQFIGVQGANGKLNSLARSNASLYGTKDDLYDRLKRHAYTGKKGKLLLYEPLFVLSSIKHLIWNFALFLPDKSDTDSEEH